MPYPDRFGQVENGMIEQASVQDRREREEAAYAVIARRDWENKIYEQCERDAIDDEILEPEPQEPSRMAVELTALIIEKWRAREWFFEYTESMSKEQFAAFKIEAQEEIDMWDNELR